MSQSQTTCDLIRALVADVARRADRRPGPADRHQGVTRAVAQLREQLQIEPGSARTLALAMKARDLLLLEAAGRHAASPAARAEAAQQVAAGIARASSADYDPRAIRQWARDHGIPCPDRGRYLPAHVVAAYRDAQ